MANKKNRVEVVLPNGNTIWVGEHMLKDLSRFGAVLATSRSIKTPPKELLNMPAPRKVILPTLTETKVIEPVEDPYPTSKTTPETVTITEAATGPEPTGKPKVTRRRK